MIYLDILGRCGNQMFQYAFARRLAELRGDEITVNFALLDLYKDAGVRYQNELKNFSASNNYISESGGILRVNERGSAAQKAVFRVYSLIRKLYGRLGRDQHEAEKLFRLFLSRFGIYLECHVPDKAFVLKKTGFRNVFIKGYFENPDYYNALSDELRNDFKPVKQVSAKASALIDKAKKCNSVCVSFRKWSIGGREVCGEEYYRRAFDYFLNNIDDPVFIVFSNDVDWVRSHFDLPEGCVFEPEGATIPEKIAMMSACRHFVITNSTFAWWAQFLGDYEKKIVVSPSHWFEAENEPYPLIMDSFVKL